MKCVHNLIICSVCLKKAKDERRCWHCDRSVCEKCEVTGHVYDAFEKEPKLFIACSERCAAIYKGTRELTQTAPYRPIVGTAAGFQKSIPVIAGRRIVFRDAEKVLTFYSLTLEPDE